MLKIYEGKTKNVFQMDDGNVLLEFKDSVTGTQGEIDSGGNVVWGQIEGKGKASLRLTMHFFQLLEQANIDCHFVGIGPRPNTIIVKPAQSYGIEVICREKAWGSFVRRYGKHATQGMPLPSLVEFTLKDDEKGDPLITADALVALSIANLWEIEYMAKTAKQTTALIKADLAMKGLELIDIKYEFGAVEGRPMLIDEISGDSMRVAKDNVVLLPHELADAVLGVNETS
ncbi:MAG: phosphoribosylaminoimidazolesuccinocarboxamide synthase [Firmicutes bacterium]|nr:phosphoribosylaminoimidazolesuccinocarboxamide synthase [Bacillota bacterium]